MGRKAEFSESVNTSVDEIRANIDRERKRRGLSKKRLAEMAGYAESVVNKILNGSQGMRVEDLAAMADALQVPAASLLNVKSDMDGKTLADACRALVTLDRLLGLNISADLDGRPQISFRYSGLDGFMKYYRGLQEAADDMDPGDMAAGLNVLIEKNKEKPAAVYSEKGSRAGRAVWHRLSFLILPEENPAADAPKDPAEDQKANADAMAKSEALIKRIRPKFTRAELEQMREWITDATRRQAWQEIRQVVPAELAPLPPQGSFGNDAALVRAWAETLLDSPEAEA